MYFHLLRMKERFNFLDFITRIMQINRILLKKMTEIPSRNSLFNFPIVAIEICITFCARLD